MFKGKIAFSISIILVAFSCSSNKENITDIFNKEGIQVYVAYSSECPNCKRVKADLVNTALKFSTIKFNLLPIDDTTIVSLPFFNVLNSNSKKIAKILHMTVTPEVAVLKNGEIIYLGAITDQNSQLTQGKPKATENYLEQSLQTALNDKENNKLKNVKAIGCYIEY